MAAPAFTPMLRFGAVVLCSVAALWVQAAAAPMPVIYPAKNQSAAQTDRDTAAATAPTTTSTPLDGSKLRSAAGGAAVAELTQGKAQFDRGFAACMEARGYVVK
jgi:hypothetical protein